MVASSALASGRRDVGGGEVVTNDQQRSPVFSCQRVGERVAEVESRRVAPLAESPPAHQRACGLLGIHCDDVHPDASEEFVEQLHPGRAGPGLDDDPNSTRNAADTGVAIAERVGVSQPRVSQVLKQLTEHDAVRATGHGYVGRPARLLDVYRRRARPLLRQPESYWYSTRSPAEQAPRVVELAAAKQAPVAVSADLAPDLLVPWRQPTLTIVYATESIALDAAGLVPAEDRADASIILRWTRDPTLLTPAPPWPEDVDDMPLTDPVRQWWDLLDLGGEDRIEAADRLRRAILDRAITATR